MTRQGKVRLRYALMGLSIGTFWFIGRNRPAWEEAIRIIIVFTVIIVLFRLLLARRGIRVRLVPILCTKVVLVVIAAAVETLLSRWISEPGTYVAIGLALIIALGGPHFDRHLFRYNQSTDNSREIAK